MDRVVSSLQSVSSDAVPESRDAWLLDQITELETLVEQRCDRILAVLHETALDLQTEFTEAMLRERRTCQPSERGRIGLRVRTATTSAPGMFQIEWYRVQGRHRTHYIRRGKDKQGRPRMQYHLASFGRITAWERDLIQHYEPQCARVRVLLSQIGQLRRALQPLVTGSRERLNRPDHEVDADGRL